MANLDDSDPERQAEIDTAGWLFGGFVAIIVALGALLAYQGNESLIANSSVSQLAEVTVTDRK